MKPDELIKNAKSRAKRVCLSRTKAPLTGILAVILFLTSLCMLFLTGQQPFALAAKASSSSTNLHHSAAAVLDTPVGGSSCVEDNSCYGNGPPVTITNPNNPTNQDYVFVTPCNDHFASYGSYDKDGNPTQDNNVCWSKGEFQWGNADITCILNQSLKAQINNLNHDNPGLNFGQNTLPTPAGTPVPPNSGELEGHNQNTCVNGHTCYSDNSSGNDPVPDKHGQTKIHNQVGGDDIICYNNHCSASVNGGNTGDDGSENGDVCGTGVPYDKFACSPVQSSKTGDGAWYYNPTAYNPNGVVEKAVAHFRIKGGKANGQTIDSSGDTPDCAPDGHWTCPNGDKVNLVMDEGSGQMANPFDSNNPLQISATTDTTEAIGVPSQGGGPAVVHHNWKYPPGYTVACNTLNQGWAFPCSDVANGSPDEGMIATDWLSGDVVSDTGSTKSYPSGHLIVMYNQDTINAVQPIFGMMLGVGYILIVPSIILMGYQFLWMSWTFRQANALELIPRLLLSIIAVSISWALVTTLLGLSNQLNIGIVSLHSELGYPTNHLNSLVLTYTLEGENAKASFRGIVVPISRWGCVGNEFVAILGKKLASDLSAFIPFVGGMLKMALGIADAIEVLKRLGDFIVLIMSIMLCTQVFVRIVFVNYYILATPVVFGCWSLPGGVGQKVVQQWFKGFYTLLLTQGIQLFILTTMPFLIPLFPPLPGDRWGIINIFFEQLPRIIVLGATLQTPKLMGTGATKLVAQAGSVAGGAVVAVGAAAYNVV